jgi:hypothetical protein
LFAHSFLAIDLHAVSIMNMADQIKAVVLRLKAAGHTFDVIDGSDRVVALEAKFGRRLPASFRHLVTGYAFPEFEIGGVTIFSNLDDGSPMDFSVGPFADPFMFSWLTGKGYIQFGRRDEINYDPVCFDLSEAKREPAVVVFDHEDILLERRKVRPKRLADSFLKLVETALN